VSTLFLVRHGQASFGAERYDQLSPLGHRQAAATGAHLSSRGLVFHGIYTGPRLRHRQTAQGALSALPQGSAPVATCGLDEFADPEQILASAERLFGVSIRSDHNVTHVQKVTFYFSMLSAWAEGKGVIDGSPSADQFRHSVRDWLDRHRQSTAKGQNTLAFTSAGPIAVVFCEVLDVPFVRMINLASVINNASITEIMHTPHRIALRSFNTSVHLSPDLITLL
jgi:broad specificity phosphatase PhoE